MHTVVLVCSSYCITQSSYSNAASILVKLLCCVIFRTLNFYFQFVKIFCAHFADKSCETKVKQRKRSQNMFQHLSFLKKEVDHICINSLMLVII